MTDRGTAGPSHPPHPQVLPGAPGLRERKKQRTRDALLRAALELFTSHGYDRTTVDEITEAVDVSQRTFFRYFAGKEEAAFALQDMVEACFFRAVCERPPEERPLKALRNAVAQAWDSIGEAIEQVVPIDLHMRTYQMIERTPALIAVHLRRFADLEDRLAAEIARREGVDVDEDPRPRIAVAAFGSVMRVTGRLWGASGDASMESLKALTMRYLDLLGPGLQEDWRNTGK
ncbi:TetR/AcrR family transcriptional regulator [Streptomyces sp. GC420]|uniref:TetR/AcrR family transcriptional regulator n=1 Tax=Streptomyces sp. GC420 TaxID=2697568 RepID=UPI0014150447|nr:TetR family transcriptional regulator [Streptomyces sp. GC420]NBM17161.1 TetR family transcriptional regulator [Streptomyces sp. GC420]